MAEHFYGLKILSLEVILFASFGGIIACLKKNYFHKIIYCIDHPLPEIKIVVSQTMQICFEPNVTYNFLYPALIGLIFPTSIVSYNSIEVEVIPLGIILDNPNEAS